MKLKRLLTAALSAVMALSVCALPAMAEGTGTTPTLTTSTIDKKAIGSITIYKYLRNDDHNSGAGNGESFTETITPTSSPLAGVGFTVYQVMNSDDLMTYYDEKADGNTVTVGTFWDSTTKSFKESVKHETTGKNSQNETWSGAEKKTDKNGQVTFDKLPVGMYLVMETTTPSVVKSPVAPFLVSIPMTRIGDSADASTSNNLKQWLYDVKVYPKNTTVTGQVNITKKGVTGNDTANTTLLSGVQFHLYKYNDAASQYELCKEKTGRIETPIVYETGDTGVATASGLTKGKYYFQEIGYTEAAKATGYIADTVSKYPFEIDDNGYVVASTDTIDGAADAQTFVIGLGSENKDVTIYNYKPDFDKNVKDATGNFKQDSSGKATHDADYGIGDKVPYELTITVPANIKKLHTFKVTDTMNPDQLKHVEESVKITDSKGAAYTKDTDYALTIDSTTGTMTVDFMATGLNKAKLTACAGSKITIKYQAIVQPKAAIAGSNANLNTADLIYSSTTKIDEAGNEELLPYTIEDRGVVYTFAVNINKTAQGGAQAGNGLNGVTFDLYKEATANDTKNSTGDKYWFRNKECAFINGTKAKELGLTDSEAKDWILVNTLTTDSDTAGEAGKAYEGGLPAGTYKLVETKTVGGYNLLSKPVDAKLNLEYTTTWKTNDKYVGGKLVKHDTYTTSYKEKGVEVTPGTAITIVNRAGFNLPVTGGFGTLLFSGIGVLLVLAGVSVLFSLKKKNNRA